MESNQMMMLGIFLIAVLSYPVFLRILAELAQPYRLRMAELGKKLLASPYVTERQKEFIDRMLDDAFDWRYMAMAAIYYPVFAVRRSLGFKSLGKIGEFKNPETRKLFQEFCACHTRATAAANPLFAVVFFIEMTILLLFVHGRSRTKQEVQVNTTLRVDRILHSL